MGGRSFGAFFVRRVAWALFLLVVASMLVFVVFWLVPANPQAIRPASAITSPDAAGSAFPDRSTSCKRGPQSGQALGWA